MEFNETSLKEKKAAFCARPPVTQKFQERAALFGTEQDPTEVERLKNQWGQVNNLAQTTIKQGDGTLGLGIHLMFGMAVQGQIDEKLVERFDTPFNCTASYYRDVIEDMGFELVGEYIVHVEENRTETSYIHARPDGLFLTWDTYTPSDDHPVIRNSARLHFQWSGFDDNDMLSVEGLSGSWDKSFLDEWVYLGDMDAREGVREKVRKLSLNGSVCSPFPCHIVTTRRDVLLSSQDIKSLRYEVKQNTPQMDGKEIENKVSYKKDMMADDRYKDLPLWAQQMIWPLRFEEYYHEYKQAPVALENTLSKILR